MGQLLRGDDIRPFNERRNLILLDNLNLSLKFPRVFLKYFDLRI